jgi:transposase
MRIIVVDFTHSTTNDRDVRYRHRELVEKTLEQAGNQVREFYSALLHEKILVGIEATGSMHWFLKLMEELRIECRVGHPQKIRKAETCKQKHDRWDARLILKLLAENRFPTIWMPSNEQRDLRTLLRHRHQWVRMQVACKHSAVYGALEWFAQRPFIVEPGRPTRTPSVATGSSCEPTKSRFAGFVSTHGSPRCGHGNRRQGVHAKRDAGHRRFTQR